MTSTSRFCRTALLALLLTVVWQLGAPPAHAQPVDVVKVQNMGTTYADLSARWWEWALSIPAATNPLLDPDGRYCMEGQTGQVWFLAGRAFGGSTTRACTIPAGKPIFLPVFNYVNLAPFPEETTLDLRKTIETLVDTASVLRCTIDGAPVKNLRHYRVQSPVFATFTPPNDIIVGGTTKQYWDPAVADGYWLLLAPPAPGSHQIVIHVEALNWDGSPLVLDVTLDLTIK